MVTGNWRRCVLLLLYNVAALVGAEQDFAVGKGLERWDQTDWSLSTDDFLPGHYQSRLSLANGYTGASLAAAGPFFEQDTGNLTNGWPLFNTRLSFATISGFHNVEQDLDGGSNYPWLQQYGWDSFISGIPHPTALIFSFNNQSLDATVSNASLSHFSSSISFKTGLARWSYVWTPAGSSVGFQIAYEAFFSRARANVVAVKATIKASRDATGTVTDLLDGRSALMSTPDSRGLDQNAHTVYSSVHPLNLPNVTAWVVSGLQLSKGCVQQSRRRAEGAFVSANETTVGQSFDLHLRAGVEQTFVKFVGIASTDAFADAEATARRAQRDAQADGWDALKKEHVAAWAKIITEDALDDFTDPVTGSLPSDPAVLSLHIASVANTFYILSNLNDHRSGLDTNSVSVGGLVADTYGGLVFWDAETWMAPGINIAFPGYSNQFSNYRIKQHAQALENAKFNDFPAGSSLYSWTSGRYGNCTGTGPCADYEYHLNYDIAFNLFQQYNVSNNATWFNNGPRQIIDSTAIMTSHLLQYNSTTGSYWIHNMTDPDEYANHIDNGAFTIASAAQFLHQYNRLLESTGVSANTLYNEQAAKIAFPRAISGITLEYQTMNNSAVVKQADVVLLTYPLDYGQNYTSANAIADLDYYAERQSPDGPAMTYSIFAINANTLSTSGCSAYTYTLNGFTPYLRAPWYQFSEQLDDNPATNGGTNPAFPFLTGHGGANQVVPFGYLGIRTDQDVLFINPALPPQIAHVKVRTFYYGGAKLQASMNGTHTNLTRLPTPADVPVIDKYLSQSMPFTLGSPHSGATPSTHHIAINETVTLPNRLYSSVLTETNNIVQCLPASSPDTHLPGQFPLGAIDGSAATRWQPASNTTASFTIDTSSVAPAPLNSLVFDWGARPPVHASVYVGNGTAAAAGTLLWEGAVDVSSAWDPAQTEVRPVVGNRTVVDVAARGLWSGRVVRVVVEGCWVVDGKGSTVGEVAVIRG